VRVKGVATGDMGVGRDGSPRPQLQPGMELRGRYTLFAEGCRGSLTKQLFERFELREGAEPQTYGIGIKELWEVDPAKHEPGPSSTPSAGRWTRHTYGGSWLYHLENNQVRRLRGRPRLRNPHLSPFDEMQRFKTHPAIRPCSKAAGASPTAPGRSTKAACSRCRS
jgi:electron-transferring-flavoprotein dehydrogenase